VLRVESALGPSIRMREAARRARERHDTMLVSRARSRIEDDRRSRASSNRTQSRCPRMKEGSTRPEGVCPSYRPPVIGAMKAQLRSREIFVRDGPARGIEAIRFVLRVDGANAPVTARRFARIVQVRTIVPAPERRRRPTISRTVRRVIAHRRHRTGR